MNDNLGNMAIAAIFCLVILAGGLQYIGKLDDILLNVADSMGGIVGQVIGQLLVSLAGAL